MVTLADLRAREVFLHWAEAVAITRALIELCPRGDEAGNRVPEAHEVQISADGTLSILGLGPSAKDAVQRIARIFDGMVAEHDLPVQLRLVAVTALAASGPYDSLMALHEALGPFERPNRMAQIASAYERYRVALAAKPQPIGQAEPPPPQPAVRLSTKTQASAGQPFWRRKRVALAVVAAVVAAGGAWWLLSASGAAGTFDVRHVPSAVTRTASAVTAAVAAGAQDLAARVGIGRTSGAAAGQRRPEAAPEPAAAPPPPRRPGPDAAGTLRSRTIVPRTSFVFQAPAPPIQPSPPLLAATAPMEPEPEPEAAPPPPPPDLSIIYSASDPDVQPPVLLRPQMPVDPPPGRRLEDMPLVEIVVSEYGEVESVKLLTPPRAPNDIMMLSAAKAWLFQPAICNGAYVRSRTLVRITLP
ncbi:MAG: hypothetical protein ACE148_15625 [Vicinamibacterales bacterium]